MRPLRSKKKTFEVVKLHALRYDFFKCFKFSLIKLFELTHTSLKGAFGQSTNEGPKKLSDTGCLSYIPTNDQ